MLPNLPTDNLYKLVTMLGLALIIGAAYVFEPFGGSLLLDRDGGKADAIILHHRLQAAGLAASVPNTEITETAPHLLYEENYIAIQKLAATSPLYLELRDLNERVFIDRSKAISFQSKYNVNSSFFSIFLGIGSAMSFFGFVSWYRYFQRYQDIISRQQAAISSLENQIKRFELDAAVAAMKSTHDGKIAGERRGSSADC